MEIKRNERNPLEKELNQSTFVFVNFLYFLSVFYLIDMSYFYSFVVICINLYLLYCLQ